MALNSDYSLGTLNSERKLSHNDASLDVFLEDGTVTARLPNGNLVRFILYIRKHWKFSYSYIYGEDKYIHDNGLGRNALYALYTANAEMSFLEPNDQGATVAYTVAFSPGSWDETLVYRDGDKWAWQLAFELVQTK
jgi:hypothetical protein